MALAVALERELATIKDGEQRYRMLFDNMLEGFAHCRAICDPPR